MNEIENLKKALAREHTARKEAEKIIEQKSAELYRSNEELRQLNSCLEKEISRRTKEIEALALFPEEIPDPVLRISKTGRIVYANPSSRERLLTFFNLQVGDPHPQLFQSSITEALETQQPVSKEYAIDGFHYLIYFSSLKNLNYINILARDITDIKKAQNLQEHSERRYRQIVESASDVIYRMNPEGRFTFVNPVASRILQASEEELLSMHFSQVVHPQYLQEVEDFYRQQFQNRVSTTYLEFPVMLKSGAVLWIGQNVQVSEDEENRTELTALARDITDRKKAEEALHLTSTRLSTLISSMHTGVVVENEERQVIHANEHFCKMFNLNTDASLLTGQEYTVRVEELASRMADPQAFKKSLDSILTKKELRVDEEVVMADGRIMERDYVPIVADKKFLGHLWQYRDITEKKNVEEHVQKSLKQQKLLSDISFLFSSVMEDLSDPISLAIQKLGEHTNTSRVYIFENSADGVFTTNTFEWCSQGIRPQIENMQNLPYSVVPSYKKKLLRSGGIICADISELPEDIQDVVEPQQIKSIMLFPIFVKKRYVGFVGVDECLRYRQWAESEVQLFRTFTHLLGNVFERQEVERQLLASEEKYRSAVDNLTEVIFQTDEKSFLTFLNPAWSDITGYALEESLGRNLMDYIYPEDRIEMDELYELLMDQKIDFCRQTLRLSIKDGETRWIEIYARVTLDLFNQIEGISGTLNDVTDRKRAEEALIQAKEQAEQASLAKAQFLSTMSHEIRTPMNAVIGISNLLLKNNPRPDQQTNLSLLKFSGENLLHLLNDILDFSKIEAGKVAFEEVDFNLKILLSGIKHSLGTKATEDKNLKLRMRLREEMPDMLVGDPTRLSQVLNNLVGNAIKFTEEGSVTLSVDVLKKTEEAVKLRFCVSDTGIGIPKDKLEHIFDSFSQASSDTTRKYGGTGLGLTITKKLLELQGSHIQVESEIGRGSKFFFELSFKRSHLLPEEESSLQVNTAATQSLQGQPILLVEDNPVNVVVASQFLEDWGAQIVVAENGKQALDRLEEQLFSLVLMDLQMPVMDGYEAATQIRKKLSEEELPIIALTADAMQGVYEQITAVGMNDYISKPFIPDELYKKINRHLKWRVLSKEKEEISAVMKKKTVTKAEKESTVAAAPLQTEGEALLYKLDKISAQSGGNQDFIKRMTSLFVETTPPLLSEMEEALQEKDLKQVQSIAHRLKPSIDILQIDSQKDSVRTIEKIDEHSFQSSEGKQLIQSFIDTLHKVSRQLKAYNSAA